MAFSGIGKLIKDLVTGTPADTDYFAFGNTDLKKVSFPNLKKALGIDALNSALKHIDARFDKETYIQSFSVKSGQKYLYLKINKSEPNKKSYAQIFGCKNVQSVINESIYVWYDTNTKQIQFNSVGLLKPQWGVDEAGSSVRIPLPEYSSGTIIWKGFFAVGTD